MRRQPDKHPKTAARTSRAAYRMKGLIEMRNLLLAACLAFATSATAQDGFNLAPGERLLSVDGVPCDGPNVSVAVDTFAIVEAQPQCVGGRCPLRPVAAVARAVGGAIGGMVQGMRSVHEVNRDARAYAHALQEATILADRNMTGHPLGCASGCSRSGTGYSYSDTPTHCFAGELPDSMLVARACVIRNGRYYWSAHYR